MKRNKANIIYGVVLSGLLFYFFYLIKTVYPLMLKDNVFLCNNCLNSVSLVTLKTLSILGLVALGNLLIGFVNTIRFRNSLHPVYSKSNYIRSLEKRYCLQDKITVFTDVRLMAFCLGAFKPRIYLSTQLLKRMSRSEIEAIILHEKQHIVGKDNLLLLFLNLIKTALFFFPVVADFVENIEIQKEISADKAVVNQIDGKMNIISALRKVIESKPSLVYANTFSEGFTIEPRVRALVGKKNRTLSLKLSSIVISLGVFLFLANTTISRIEIHPQDNNVTMLCIDKPTCQNSCQ